MNNLRSSFFKFELVILLVAFTSSLTFSQNTSLEASRPNIIYILLDDLGYSDIGAFGGEIQTPNIDKLAKEGIKLPNMCNAAICNITRTTLLTSKYDRRVQPNENNSLPARLKSVDYNTYMVGKSHLRNHPNDIGFDRFYGFLGGQTSVFRPVRAAADQFQFQEDKTILRNLPANFYATDACTDKAIEYINSNAPLNNKPFFLYLAYQAPHVPIQAPDNEIEKYRGVFLRGWEKHRNERLNNMKKSGLIDQDANVSELPSTVFSDWDQLTPEQRDLEDYRMAAYAAMVDIVDQGIGKIIKNLKDNNQLENTLIVFSSDNGATSTGRFDEEQALIRDGKLPGGRAGLWFPGTGWGYVNNTPWDNFKSSNFAGGVQTGAILYWPAKINPETFTTNPMGAINKSLLHVADFMPTCLDVAFPANEATRRNNIKNGLDGVSMLPVMQTEEIEIRNKPLFFHMNDDRAIRTERWSMVEHDRAQGAPENWQLFEHRFNDFAELNNVANSNRAVRNDLKGQWEAWFDRNYRPGNRTVQSKARYEVVPMVARHRGTKYGYMEAVGSDHLSNAEALSNPEINNKPIATTFRGSSLQFNASSNLGIDGYPIALDLSADNLVHKLVLKEKTPAVMRLDVYEIDPGENFIFEYVNVPRDVFVYSGKYSNANPISNLQNLDRVNSMNALRNATQTSWYWNNGSAFLKYVAPNQYTYTSSTGGFDNLYFCLERNCSGDNSVPVEISDFSEIETRFSLTPRNNVDFEPLTQVTDSGIEFTLENNQDGQGGCIDFEMNLSLQNWVGVSQLNINVTGAIGAEILVKDQSANLVSIGEVSKEGWNVLPLSLNTAQADQVEGLVLRICESDVPAGASQVIKLDELTIGDFTPPVVLSTENKQSNDLQKSIEVYPNPTAGMVHLSRSTSWAVFTSSGIKVKEGTSDKIDLTQENTGLYFIHVNGKTIALARQ